jgi:hypothetical protein
VLGHRFLSLAVLAGNQTLVPDNDVC